MPRKSRIVLEGFPILTFQQTLDGVTAFRDRRDFETCLSFVSEAVIDFGVSLHAYSLTSSQVYFVLSIPEKTVLAKFFQSIGRRYSQYYNVRYGRAGTIWKGRFLSSSFDSKHYLLEAIRFVDLTATRLRQVDQPEHHPHSSYHHHVGLIADQRLSDHQIYWQLGNTPFERQYRYRELAIEGTSLKMQQKIVDHLRAGWHLGEAPALVDGRLNGRLNGPAQRGRPPKQQNEPVDSVPI
jgi:putative transposase